MFDLDRIDDAVRHENGVSRRLFLGYAAALAATPLLAEVARGQSATTRPTFASDPFTLGVASGDPDATSVVLWTKLAPRPLDPDGGMSADNVEVTWEVADDEAMTKPMKRGAAVATAKLGHSVHVEVGGLAPDRWYWYRFRAGDAETKPARTRTLPAADAMPASLALAFSSCQHYEAGFYTAYNAMAKDELDLVFFLGDYIYEGAGKDGGARRHVGPKLLTLDDYRQRHSQYKTDPMLRAAHARCPWFVTWDDHEVDNNYANDHDDRGKLDSAQCLRRRAAAYQAYYEMMPLRARSLPKGPDMQLYRRASFGRLAELHVLDTRQFRSPQPNGDKASPLNAAAMAATQTIMGATQRQWLEDGLTQSPGTWNVIAQQVMMGMLGRRPESAATAAATGEHGVHADDHLYSMDAWTGYARERIGLVQYMADHKVKNPVVLTGDVHCNYLNELRADDRQTDAPIVATEFVGTSITSAGDGVDRPKDADTLLADNAGLRFYNRQRGYVRCDVNAERWHADYVTVDHVTTLGAAAKTRASFVVESGRPGVKPA